MSDPTNNLGPIQTVRDAAAIFLVLALLVACVAALVGASHYTITHGGPAAVIASAERPAGIIVD